VERPDIPNVLDREFTVSALNEVWCGDTTGSGSLAHLVAVIDLFARRVVGRSPMPTW
jgi:putative transposase